MTHPLKRWSLTALCAVGAGLSVYLAALKFFALPCLGGGGCHAIIHSGYGSVFGVPVGVFSALLWFSAIFVSDDTKRRALLFLLALGAAVFMGIQLFLLRGFCAYCTAHAVAAWIAVFLASERPYRSAAVFGLLIAGAGFGLTRWHVASRTATPVVSAAEGTPLSAAPGGLPWLGSLAPESPALVISVNCAACLDLLEELSRQTYSKRPNGPALFFRVTDQNRELTLAFISGILATKKPNREAFLAHVALLLSVKDQALSSPEVAAIQLQGFSPTAAAYRGEAESILQTQTEALKAAGTPDTTPLLVFTGAKPRAFFRTEELFP